MAKAPSGAGDKNAPQLAPFYWGVKDGKDPKMLRKVQKFSKVPYFMDAHANHEEVMGSPEFWFSRPGAGAKAHMDSHCESTMSLQLDGTKRWRIGLAAPTDRFLRLGTYGDGQVYKQPGGWTPTYDFELHKGEVLFFPPAFIHESTNVGGGCAASLTHQYSSPMAAGFFRSWWPRTRRIGDMNECWGKISSWATLNRPISAQSGDEGGDAAKKLFASVDANSDGSITSEEMQRARTDAENSMGFHDTDQNGVVSREEFMENFALWNDVEHEVHMETGRASWPHTRGHHGHGHEDEEDGEDGQDEEDGQDL